jgi:hypothetical protein
MASPKKSVYIETTIPSLITARLSRDIGILFRQQKATEFWENETGGSRKWIANMKNLKTP